MNLPFLHTKQKPATPQQPSVAVNLEGVSIHVMPTKFTKGIAAPASSTKAVGIAIISIGILIAVGGAFALYYYIFSAPQRSTVSREQQSLAPYDTSLTPTPTPEQPASSTEAGLPETKSCDPIQFFSSYGSKDPAADAGLVCLGERLISCTPASVTVQTDDLGMVSFAVIGMSNGRCLVQTSYPAQAQIINEQLVAYANTSLQCAYDPAALNGGAADVAQRVYQQASVGGLQETTVCVGSAVDTWRTLAAKKPATQGDAVIAGLDSDQDGLSDVEEEFVYGTDSTKSDTDTDGYTDGTELMNLYNPAGAGLAQDKGLFSAYRNSVIGYTLLYPKPWRLQETASSTVVQFLATTDGFIQVITQPKETGQSLESWYAAINPATERPRIEVLKSGLELVMSADGLTAYMAETDGAVVYVVSYGTGETRKAEFTATLRALINSFASFVKP